MCGLPYLFKLRHTAKVKTPVRKVLPCGEGWLDSGEGWEAAEARIRLGGWSRERRVVIVRKSNLSNLSDKIKLISGRRGEKYA
jgi:hypothetical protein